MKARRGARLMCALGLGLLLACDAEPGGEGGGAGSTPRDAAPESRPVDADLADQPDAKQAAPPAPGDAGRADAALSDDDAGSPRADGGEAPDAQLPAARRGRVSLVDQSAWVELPADDDPWNDRPPDSACEPEGYGAELFGDVPSYFVDTARCGYRTVTQASLTEVRAGEEVVVRVWYFDLYGPDGAEAHLALRIGERDVVDETIAIPAATALIREHFVAGEAIAAGTPITLHVHNHGANQYYLLEVSTGPVGL